MRDAIILLAPTEEQEEATAPLRTAAPNLAIHTVTDAADLRLAVAREPDARLLSVCSPVIVPADLLAALPGPAYNLHPGPPAYPGLYPAAFALYEGATTFGVTLHEMTADIDAGAIVATNAVDIPADMDRLGLETLSRQLARHLLRGMAPALADLSRPLPPVGVPWIGHVRRQADFEALCRLPPDATDDEFRRRLRAVGEGPHHALRVPLFGRWFRLEPLRPDAPVIKGGRPVEHRRR
jgi:methionyl-tRNA formyltransferase